ncbi:hypothetical protein [Streptomyces cinereospinus]|uniref:Uncharacterized protein n=1 Tax=Streptomyces cinereospinus TaxID=285561 RepID=A0ABV5NBZ3_9ACTN
MKATSTVARWTWGRDDEARDGLTACLHDLLAAHLVLGRHRLMVGTPRVSVSVHEAGKKGSYLFQGEFEPAAGAAPEAAARDISARIEAALAPGETGSVYADLRSAGEVPGGAAAREEAELVTLRASALLGHVSVELATRSDVWLPYDLKGRPQPAVHAANGPRLAAALRDISEALDSDTDPEDATYFAKPNETGAENLSGSDGEALDVWESFEVPHRYRTFTQTPGFGRTGYRRSTEGQVQYLPVRRGQETLGYLWASDAENAAGFEPKGVGDDAVYRAGLVWLERLRSAHDRGLSPSAALAESAGLADEEGAGRVAVAARPQSSDLAALRGLAADD